MAESYYAGRILFICRGSVLRCGRRYGPRVSFAPKSARPTALPYAAATARRTAIRASLRARGSGSTKREVAKISDEGVCRVFPWGCSLVCSARAPIDL